MLFLFLIGKAYEYLKKELIETAYGVKGLVKEKKQNYEGTYTRGIILGVVFCILAVIPLLIGIAMEQPEYMITSDVSILLLLVAVGVFLIVRVSTINGSYDMLLQEGEYSQKEKAVKKKFEIYSTAYWCIATAIYLGWSFLSVRWDYTWILWPVAGVLFGIVSLKGGSAMKMIRRISNLVSLCMLLAYVIVLVCIWSRIPGTVPTHFNAAGIADSYGGKGILWIEVIAATVILLLLSLIEKVPSIWNFPVAVTEENKERLYKIALVMLGAIKILTTGLFIDVGVSSLVTRFPVWPMYIMLGAMVIVIVVAVVQMIRAK